MDEAVGEREARLGIRMKGDWLKTLEIEDANQN
jgi:hypothetical protein